MTLSRCVACGLPVLEIDGQFSMLDSLFIQNGSPPPATAGWWHARCLADSDAGPAWFAARLRNYREVRRFEVVAEPAGWTVLHHPQRGKTLALARHGEQIDLSIGGHRQARAVEGGLIFPRVDDEFHLELEDASIIQAIKDGLVTRGRYPLPAVIAALGIADRVVHPEAIERGVFQLVPALQHHWGEHAVSASVSYGVFIPTELESYVGERVR